ncbi:MAG: hypothetical protein ACLQA5_08205 [Solirubrobacteraceae bacterium]
MNAVSTVERLVEIVHLISLAERRPRACSVENAEVGLEHDHHEVDSCIAWLSERLASGPTLTAQFVRRDSLKRVALALPGCRIRK